MIRTAHPASRSAPKPPLAQFLREQSTLLLLAGVLVGGILLGRYGSGLLGRQVNDAAYQLVAGYSLGNVGTGFSQSFLATFSASFGLLLGLLFCAFCAISAPLIVAIILLHGVGIGLCYSLVFSVYGMSALGYVLVILLPNALLTVLVLLEGAQLALEQAGEMFQRAFRSGGVFSPLPSQIIVVKFITLTSILALSAAMYALAMSLWGTALAPAG